MNKKLRKVSWGLGTFAAGILPVAAIVSCSATVQTLNYDGTKKLVEATTGDDFLKSVENLGQQDQTTLNNVEYQSTFYMYGEEQVGSIETQKMYFRWNIFTLKRDLVDVDLIKTDKDEEKTRTDAINDDIKKNTDKLAVLNKPDEIPYDSSSFTSDYPKVLQPISGIRTRQEKIFKDAKANFISQFATAAQGKEQWPEELKTKYNGATTDATGIDFLVHGVVGGKAFLRYNFVLNTDFTNEMMNATYDNGGTQTKIFSFLDSTKTEIGFVDADESLKDDYKKDNKVYFVSSKSLIPAKILVEGSIQSALDNQRIVAVQNVMVPGKPSETDPRAPWEIVKEGKDGKVSDQDLLPILRVLTYNSDGTSFSRNKLEDLFKQGNEDKDKEYVRFYSGTTDSTQYKSGYLGLMPVLSYVAKMAPGFGIGVLEETMDGTDVDHNLPSISATKIIKALTDGLASLSAELGTTVPSSNREIKNLLTNATAAQINKNFGGQMRDLFNPSVGGHRKGIATLYKFANSATGTFAGDIAISSFGIHIIKSHDFSKKSERQSALLDDLNKLAKDQLQESDASIAIWRTYTEYFTQVRKLQNVLALGTAGGTVKGDFEKFLEDNKVDLGKKENGDAHTPASFIKDATELITNTVNGQSVILGKTSVKKGVDKFMTLIDNHIRTLGTTRELEDFYHKAFAIAGEVVK